MIFDVCVFDHLKKNAELFAKDLQSLLFIYQLKRRIYVEINFISFIQWNLLFSDVYSFRLSKWTPSKQ